MPSPHETLDRLIARRERLELRLLAAERALADFDRRHPQALDELERRREGDADEVLHQRTLEVDPAPTHRLPGVS